MNEEQFAAVQRFPCDQIIAHVRVERVDVAPGTAQQNIRTSSRDQEVDAGATREISARRSRNQEVIARSSGDIDIFDAGQGITCILCGEEKFRPGFQNIVKKQSQGRAAGSISGGEGSAIQRRPLAVIHLDKQ